MTEQQACVVGIDVAKATLDIHVRPTGQAWTVSNADRDIQALVAQVRPLAPSLLVLEATGGGLSWARDGREIFFISAQDSMTVLTLAPGRDLVVTDERTLFDAQDLVDRSPAPDGRFLAVQSDQVAAERRLIVVENVFEELRRRVRR